MRRCLERCPECPTRHDPSLDKNVVPGEGPEDADVCIVLEGPGKQENNFRRPAVGKTGDEINNVYLPLAGLSRPNVYVTNTFKCHWADTGDTPPQKVIDSCANFHLKRELASHDFKLVVLAGSIAAQQVGLNIDTAHGVLVKGDLLGWRGKLFPTYHPALGIHMPDRMQALLDDFRLLRQILRGEVGIQRDEYPDRQFHKLVTKSDVSVALGAADLDQPIAIDTESRRRWNGYPNTIHYIPHCLTFAVDPYNGYMIRESDAGAMGEFGDQIGKFETIVMHNSPHDMRVLADMGIRIPWKVVRDTMQLAYNDGRLSRGLKALCWRLLAMQMRDFDDVVGPYGLVKQLEYVEQAMMMDWPEPTQEWTGEWEWKKCPECKGTTILTVGRGKAKKSYPCDCDHGIVQVKRMTRRQGIKAKLSRLVGDYTKDGTVDVYKRWTGWGSEIDPLVTKLGPLPLPSIEQVPEEEAMEYACSDPIGTLRLYPVMLERLREIKESYGD